MIRGIQEKEVHGGGKRIRTDDPLLAKQMLYQLSYTPMNQTEHTKSP